MMHHLFALHSFFMKVSLSVSKMAEAFLASLLLAMILAPYLESAKLCRSSSAGDGSLGCGWLGVLVSSIGTSLSGMAVSFVSACIGQTVVSAVADALCMSLSVAKACTVNKVNGGRDMRQRETTAAQASTTFVDE